MSAIVIVNIVFAGLVVAGILSLLGWAIVADRGIAFGRVRHIRSAAHGQAARPMRRRGESALDLNA